MKIEDLGMLDKQLERVKQLVATKGGLVLVAAPPGQGLTSLLYAILRAHDAFLSHIVTVERAPDTELEGVTQNKLALNAPPAEEAKAVAWMVSQQPDVVLVSSIEDPRSALELIEFSGEKRAYVGLRAGNTFEALSQWRKLVGDDKLAVKNLSMIISGRLARRLCSACKLGYAPDPDTLRKLNLDPARVTKLFQARNEPLRDAKGNPIPCQFCHDMRYKGRIGFFEMFPIDDDVREVVAAGASSSQLKAAFRKQKARYLQESALELVEVGETSVQEVLRSLRGDSATPRQSSSSAAPAAAK
jgi:type II secretory ATPase GspE/PulE/Tfp pilus assembly ATPase PilB-like protein